MAAKHLDEHHLGETAQHGGSACPPFPGFLDDQRRKGGMPTRGHRFQVHLPRQAGQKRIERASVAPEEATHEFGVMGKPGAQLDDLGKAIRGVIGAGGTLEAALARHDVRVAVRKDEGITRHQFHLLLARHAAEAPASRQEVIGNQVLGRGENARRKLIGRRGLDAPPVGSLNLVEVGPVEADQAQHVGKRIHAQA